MSNKAAILDKLRNYEYEKCDCGGAVGDIYALAWAAEIIAQEETGEGEDR